MDVNGETSGGFRGKAEDMAEKRQQGGRRMVRTYLDEASWGDENFLDIEAAKSRKERRQLPEGCRSQVLYSGILRIAWPSMVELFLASLCGMADMIMVGSMANGDDAISAVSLSNQPKFIFISLIMALNVGVTATVARARGAEEHERANEALRQGLFFCLLVCVFASVVGYIFARPLTVFMANSGLSEEVIGMSTTYLKVQMIGFATMGIAATYTAALRGSGNTTLPMVYNIIANIVNIILNYLLINGHFGFPAWGVFGASVATVLGQTVSMIIAIVANGSGRFYFSVKITDFLHGFRPDIPIIRNIAKVGIPSLGEQFLMRVGFILFGRQVATLGQPYYATHNICMNIQSMSFMLGQAMAVSSTTLVGQSLGKRRSDLAEHYSRRCERLGLLLAVILGTFFAVCNQWLVGLYSDTPAVLAAALPVMILIGVLQPIQIPQFVLSGALRGAGDTKSTALVTMVGILILRPVMGHLFINILRAGLMGAWIAIAIDQVVRTGLVMGIYASGKWKRIKMKI